MKLKLKKTGQKHFWNEPLALATISALLVSDEMYYNQSAKLSRGRFTLVVLRYLLSEFWCGSISLNSSFPEGYWARAKSRKKKESLNSFTSLWTLSLFKHIRHSHNLVYTEHCHKGAEYLLCRDPGPTFQQKNKRGCLEQHCAFLRYEAKAKMNKTTLFFL